MRAEYWDHIVQEEESEESLDHAYSDALQTAVAAGCVRSDVPDSSATDADTAAHIKVHSSGSTPQMCWYPCISLGLP